LLKHVVETNSCTGKDLATFLVPPRTSGVLERKGFAVSSYEKEKRKDLVVPNNTEAVKPGAAPNMSPAGCTFGLVLLATPPTAVIDSQVLSAQRNTTKTRTLPCDVEPCDASSKL